jgi:TPR repeat protein
MRLAKLHLQALLGPSTFAAHQLGAIYATGSEVPKDEVKAVRWYRFGAKRGDPESQYDLGFMILLGEGTPADTKTAAYWLQKAAAKGHESSLRLLGDIEKGTWPRPSV